MKRPALPSLRSFSRPAVLLPWLFSAAGLLAGAGAHAQTSPYSLRISERLGFDSNIFRTREGSEQRDYTSTTSVTLGVDQAISRQRLYARATADYLAYKGNTQLNGLGYDLIGGVDWALGAKLTGGARVTLRQAQANLADYGALSTVRSQENRERASLFDFNGIYGGTNLLAVEVLYNHTDIAYSNPLFRTRERQSDTVGAGLRVRPSPDWTYGVIWRETRGEYPQGALIGGNPAPDEYDRSDIDFTAALRVSELSSFNGRLSYTKETHNPIGTRSVNGLTGEISGVYRPTGKIEFGAGVSRDTGSSASSSQLSTLTGTSGTSGTSAGSAIGSTGISNASVGSGYLNDARLSDRLRVAVAWDATAKIRVIGGFSYSRDRYDTLFVTGTTGTLGQETGSTQGATLGAGYAFSRAVSFECQLGRESRSAGGVLGSSYDYTANTAFCGAALLIQ